MFIKSIFIILPLFILLSCSRTDDSNFYETHLNWLLKRPVPNNVIKTPIPARRNLLLSYEISQNSPDYEYLYDKSFIYDNALAVIAFSSARLWDNARRLLFSIASLLREDGSLFFSYKTTSNWPAENNLKYSLIRTGAIAWAGYAFTFFLHNNPNIDKKGETYKRLLSTAEKIGRYIQRQEVTDSLHPLFGLVKGGVGNIKLELDSSGAIIEIWNNNKIEWASSEHNIDSWLFLSSLAELTNNESYFASASRIAKSLVEKLYSKKFQQFFRGIKGGGKIDSVLALDCASWGAVMLSQIEKRDEAIATLDNLKIRYASKAKNLKGFLPYTEISIYEKSEVNSYFYPNKPSQKWGDFPFVWLEGSYGVALAEYYCGKKSSAKKQLKNYSEYFQKGGLGGIPYSLGENDIPYQFSKLKSVSSTAWHLILYNHLFKPPLSHPFFSVRL